jgi:hypothetical protein
VRCRWSILDTSLHDSVFILAGSVRLDDEALLEFPPPVAVIPFLVLLRRASTLICSFGSAARSAVHSHTLDSLQARSPQLKKVLRIPYVASQF